MTEQDYIESAKRWNPELFAAGKIAITPDALEVVIRRAWRSGRDSAPKPENPFPDIFDSFRK